MNDFGEQQRVARRWRIPIAVGVVGALSGVVLAVAIAMQTGTTAGERDHVRAFLEGQPIRAQDISRYHCHDLESPVIRCFRRAADRDVDVDAHEGDR